MVTVHFKDTFGIMPTGWQTADFVAIGKLAEFVDANCGHWTNWYTTDPYLSLRRRFAVILAGQSRREFPGVAMGGDGRLGPAETNGECDV